MFHTTLILTNMKYKRIMKNFSNCKEYINEQFYLLNFQSVWGICIYCVSIFYLYLYNCLISGKKLKGIFIIKIIILSTLIIDTNEMYYNILHPI